MTGGQADGGNRWLMPVTVFCFVLAAQLWLVAAAGTDIPFHDQWDVEGRGLYPVLREGTASLAGLFQPHNEHRIVWTHLLNRLLFSLNGQWDPLVQMVANAGLHATGAGLLAGLLAAGRVARAGWLLGGVVALFSLPLAGWHNALWGFQSQVYFAVLFSLSAFALLSEPNRSIGRTVTGWLAAGAALLAMGPGLLVPLALACGLVLRAKEGRVHRCEALVVLVFVLVAGWLHRPEPGHAALRAESAGQFFSAFGRLLAWPHTAQPWSALILNAPLAVLLVGRLTRRRVAVVGEEFVLLLAGWGLLVAAGAAWSRGGGAEFVSGVPSRYADFLVILPLANVWCAMELARKAAPRLRWGAVVWGVFLFVGWLGLSAEVMRGLVLPRARDREAPVRLIQEFQRTGDATIFAGQPRLLVPHPDMASVRAVLDDPRMQGALPPSLQPERPMGPLSRGVRWLLGR